MHLSQKPYFTVILRWTILGLLIGVSSCSPEKKKRNSHIVIGGEIVNPTENIVIIHSSNNFGDTILLKENNRFSHLLSKQKAGIYKIGHNREHQMCILEPGDSIMLRLNTLEFDESLVFSGFGAKKNNFLIDMCLKNEEERELLATLQSLNPTDFLEKINSLQNKREKKFKKLNTKVNLSPYAQKVCKASYEYHYYAQKENYILRKYLKSSAPNQDVSQSNQVKSNLKLPNDFFKHRVAFNDESLVNLYDYELFLNSYINTVSVMENYSVTKSIPQEPEWTMQKLKLINKIITNDQQKNTQLLFCIREYLFFNKKNNRKAIKEIVRYYLNSSTSQRNNAYIKRITKIPSNSKKGDLIPNQKLLAYDGTKIKLHELLKKDLTVIYFWSYNEQKAHLKIRNQIEKLRKQYPQFGFIGINRDDDSTKKWQKLLSQYKNTTTDEYQFTDVKRATEQLRISINIGKNNTRNFVINKKGKILSSSSDIFDPDFPKELEEYIKQP